jgi:hypothetical protein
MRLVFAVALLLSAPIASSEAALKPPAPATRRTLAEFCPCCRKACVKPWSIPDRWADTFVFPGHQDWANNGIWDHEPFQDTNGNGYYDQSEPFTDQNGDGQYNEEYYHPLNTGYVAWKDAGLPIVLKPGSTDGPTVSSHYNAVVLSADERDDPTGNRYEWDITNCNSTYFGPGDTVQFHPGDMKSPTTRGVRALIDRDPSAHWDPATQQVLSPAGDYSPRIIFFPLTDPRTGIPSGRKTAIVAKIAAFFVDSIDADGNVVGRFIRVASPFGSLSCPIGYPPEAAFISTCAP